MTTACTFVYTDYYILAPIKMQSTNAICIHNPAI